MKRVVAFLLALLFAYALIGCVAGSTQVGEWRSTVYSLNSYLQSYKLAPYRSEALKYGEKAEKSLNHLAKKIQ